MPQRKGKHFIPVANWQLSERGGAALIQWLASAFPVSPHVTRTA